MPIVAMPWSHSMKKPKGRWVGSSIKGGGWWPGFHRHAVTVMLVLSLLIWLELRERDHHPKRGRSRDPFLPLPDRWRRALPEVHREVISQD
jgi:hypothetical protein